MANNTDSQSFLDEYFIGITHIVATRSTCPREDVGAVIVIDNHILISGWNGAPNGLPACKDDGCIMVDNHCVRALHAEQKAFLHASITSFNLLSATLYVTHQPCFICAKMIIEAGIKRVVFEYDYPDKLGISFFQESGVEYIKLTKSQ